MIFSVSLSLMEVNLRFFEWKLLALFHQNKSIYTDIGKESCIALDVALESSRCEAIVEGFYILVNVRKRSGGQSNDILVQKVLVVWILPHSVSCPKSMKQIARIYTDGDPKTGQIKHRLSTFFDKREPACKIRKKQSCRQAQKRTSSFFFYCLIYNAFIL